MSNKDTDTRFQGKLIVITGGGGNFGRRGCQYFAQRGANVAALDNNSNALNETITELTSSSNNNITIKGYTCDITNAEEVEETIESITKDFNCNGKIDMLWNNAGYQGEIKPTLEYDTADFARVMNINVTGMFIVLQAVAKRMKASYDSIQQTTTRSEGSTTASHPFSIVNTASVAALRGTPAMVAYSSSKAAILAMTVSTAKV